MKTLPLLFLCLYALSCSIGATGRLPRDAAVTQTMHFEGKPFLKTTCYEKNNPHKKNSRSAHIWLENLTENNIGVCGYGDQLSHDSLLSVFFFSNLEYTCDFRVIKPHKTVDLAVSLSDAGAKAWEISFEIAPDIQALSFTDCLLHAPKIQSGVWYCAFKDIPKTDVVLYTSLRRIELYLPKH